MESHLSPQALVGVSYLFDRIIDRSRIVGRPDVLTTFFGTKVFRSQGGKPQTKIIDRDKAHAVIKTWYKKGWITQHESEGCLSRTAPLTKLRSSFFGPPLSVTRRSRPDNMFDITSSINRCYWSIERALKTLMAEVGISYV
jgi:hypothetical protein